MIKKLAKALIVYKIFNNFGCILYSIHIALLVTMLVFCNSLINMINMKYKQ